MSELRKDPLVERWVIIAPERGRFPWPLTPEPAPPPDAVSPFAEGQEAHTPPEIWAVRAPGTPPNSPGWDVRVVPNRFPALQVEGQLDGQAEGIFDAVAGIGAHEVIVEAPRADVDLCDLPAPHLALVLLAYIERIRDLRRDLRLRYVAVFRNKGRAAGATVNHPLSQLVALPTIPPLPMAKLRSAREHYRRKERSIFSDIIRQEEAHGERVVLQTEHFIVLAPYASRSPFELVIYPRRQCHDLTLISDAERLDLAEVLGNVLRRLRVALNDPPYNYMLFTSPNAIPRPGRADWWSSLEVDYRWHLEIVPRLTAAGGFSAASGCYLNPVAPEEAAAFLRTVS
jgi:UDPglucose--hexose-1-phosphate uridylyltransferase